MIAILLLILGLGMVLGGASLLTDGASHLARKMRISEIVIGLTIVSFGTSAPELTISLSSALQGSADLSVGNVIGSNVFNSLLIVGITAICAPIVITKNTLTKEVPLCILASLVICICCSDMLLSQGKENVVSRSEGLILLCFFAIFLAYSFAIAKDDQSESKPVNLLPLWKSIPMIILGLAGLVWGGDLFVDGATSVARNLGISERVIGITIVAGGTSLPELATSVVAAMKKNPEIAIGNVVGSNLFNIFLIIGASAAITPLHLSGISEMDLAALLVSSILLYVFGLFYGKRIIRRPEGILLTLCYLTYIALLIFWK